jgi:hypothetical protein
MLDAALLLDRATNSAIRAMMVPGADRRGMLGLLRFAIAGVWAGPGESVNPP